MNNKLDILVITAHPDDAELGCSGTIFKHIALGKKVGLVDLTRGELGTRGTPAIREEEARLSAALMGISIRENLNLKDGFFKNDEFNQLEVIKVIRKYQPEIVISNALFDRHPDHGRAGDLINDSSFLAGLSKVVTESNGVEQQAHRPRLLLQSIQDYYIKPDIVVDVSEFWTQKIEAIKAYKSQFFNPSYSEDEPQTYISNPDFFHIIEARALEYGKYIGSKYGEGFTCRRLLGVANLFHLK